MEQEHWKVGTDVGVASRLLCWLLCWFFGSRGVLPRSFVDTQNPLYSKARRLFAYILSLLCILRSNHDLR